MQSYQEAINNDRVPLSTLDLALFYVGPSLGFVIAPVMFYSINLTGFKYDSILQAIIMNLLCASIIAFSIYSVFVNRRQFRLKFIHSEKSDREKQDIILSLANDNKWSLVKKDVNYFKFQDTFSWTHWSYNVTIIYDNTGFYINSLNRNHKPFDSGEGKEMTKHIMDQIKSCL